MAALDDYLTMLKKLLPRGAAWQFGTGSKFSDLLTAFADELVRVHKRAVDLVKECDPRYTSELLAEWEKVAGLPDPCTGALETQAERRDAIVARLGEQGGQSRQFFIDLAAALGYTVTIDEFNPFVAGDNAGDAVAGDAWQFAWQVNAPETTIEYFTAGSNAGEPLATWGNTELECAIERAKPAHTNVIFAYGA